ncbi:MAG: hypothetical protein PHU85_15310 [Phycisphaerae bacterium]|nr:hypothetical protein [Phycisphaerae bacterium]
MDRSSSRNNVVLAAIIGGAIALGCGVPGWYWWCAGIWTLLFFLAVTNMASAIGAVLVIYPLGLWIRNSGAGSVVLAGSSSIELTILVVGWMMQLSQRRMALPRGRDITAMIVFVACGVVMFPITGSLLNGFLGFRSMVWPLMFYIIVRSEVSTFPASLRRILHFVVLSVALVSALNLMWYFDRLGVAALGAEGTLAREGGGRVVFGIMFDRMNSIIGGGPSSAGVFCAAGMLLCVGLTVKPRVGTVRRLLLLLCGVMCAYAAFLSLSRSVVVMIMVGALLYVISSELSYSIKAGGLTVAGVVAATMVFGESFAGMSLIDAIASNAVMWISALPRGLGAIVGGGLTAPGGMLVYQQADNQYVDAGWVTIWAQMGLTGLVSILVWVWAVCASYFRTVRMIKRHAAPMTWRHEAQVAGVVAMAMLLGSAHTAIIMRYGSDVIFMALAGVAVSAWQIIQRHSVQGDVPQEMATA